MNEYSLAKVQNLNKIDAKLQNIWEIKEIYLRKNT